MKQVVFIKICLHKDWRLYQSFIPWSSTSESRTKTLVPSIRCRWWSSRVWYAKTPWWCMSWEGMDGCTAWPMFRYFVAWWGRRSDGTWITTASAAWHITFCLATITGYWSRRLSFDKCITAGSLCAFLGVRGRWRCWKVRSKTWKGEKRKKSKKGV